LAPFLSSSHKNAQFGSYQNCFLPESLNCFDVQECIAKAIGNFSEAKTLFSIEPFYDCTDSRASVGRELRATGPESSNSFDAAGAAPFPSKWRRLLPPPR
jgi:hypothetical protein